MSVFIEDTITHQYASSLDLAYPGGKGGASLFDGLHRWNCYYMSRIKLNQLFSDFPMIFVYLWLPLN